jgi:cyclopropane fatty-acyl-phospholipid synthase-like methyltransferase
MKRYLSTPPSDDIQQRIISLLDVEPDHRVLDIGCGSGGTLDVLLPRLEDDARVLAVDESWACLQTVIHNHAAAIDSGKLRTADLPTTANLFMANSSYDRIVTHDMLERMAGSERLIRNIVKVLRPGGKAVIGHVDYSSIHYESDDPQTTRMLLDGYIKRRREWIHTPNFHIDTLDKIMERSSFSSFEHIVHKDSDNTFIRGSYASIFSEALAFIATQYGTMSEERVNEWKMGLYKRAQEGKFHFEMTSHLIVATR